MNITLKSVHESRLGGRSGVSASCPSICDAQYAPCRGARHREACSEEAARSRGTGPSRARLELASAHVRASLAPTLRLARGPASLQSVPRTRVAYLASGASRAPL